MFLPERPTNQLEEISKLSSIGAPTRTSTKKEDDTFWVPPPPKLQHSRNLKKEQTPIPGSYQQQTDRFELRKIETNQETDDISKVLKSIELVTLLEYHGINAEKSSQIEKKLITNFMNKYGTNNIERKLRRTITSYRSKSSRNRARKRENAEKITQKEEITVPIPPSDAWQGGSILLLKSPHPKTLSFEML